MSDCAEPCPLQRECDDPLFEEGFKFVHLPMDRCDNPDPTVKYGVESNFLVVCFWPLAA
jgi:hypothetical protein